jgi:hypothetical protein
VVINAPGGAVDIDGASFAVDTTAAGGIALTAAVGDATVQGVNATVTADTGDLTLAATGGVVDIDSESFTLNTTVAAGIALTTSNAGVVVINAPGGAVDIDGASFAVDTTAAGGIALTAAVGDATVTGVNASVIADTGDLTLTATGGVVDIDSATFTLNTTAAAGIAISAGAGTAVFSSTETSVISTAGDLTLTAIGGLVNVTGSSYALTCNAITEKSIYLHSTGAGADSSIHLHNEFGTSLGAIQLAGTLGGVNISSGLGAVSAIEIASAHADGTISIVSEGEVGNSILISVDGGTNVLSTLHLESSGTGTQAILIESDGGIFAEADKKIQIQTTGEDVEITAATSGKIIKLVQTVPLVGSGIENGSATCEWFVTSVGTAPATGHSLQITQLYIDLKGLSDGGAIHDVIGNNGNANCHFGQNSVAVLGTFLGATITMIEAAAGGAADINFYSNTLATLTQDTLATATGTAVLILDAGEWAIGAVKSLDTAWLADTYLYLTNGENATSAAYTAGKFIVTIYGRRT